MFASAAATCMLVEQALPLMPYFDDGNEFLTYSEIEAWHEKHKSTGQGVKPPSPDEWRAPLNVPLLPGIVEIGHEKVFAALGVVAFHDPESSPWGQATPDLQEWLLLPDNVSPRENKPSDAAAVAVLLAALYGDKGHLLLTAANRYLEAPRDGQ
ncbi:hypothetical protein [Streptomyces anulatus]|uniref:hypothetical protein n=1 Tax=Streptomyces anulatus TaxID=1892 RepID=UPI001C280679|nr:hypothetical protein [Streptomyces anulatus]